MLGRRPTSRPSGVWRLHHSHGWAPELDLNRAARLQTRGVFRFEAAIILRHWTTLTAMETINRRVAVNLEGDVVVKAGQYKRVYNAMPLFGRAKVSGPVDAPGP